MDLLVVAAGKRHWVVTRDEAIEAKGKGTMQTYWLNPRSHASHSVVSSSDNSYSSGRPSLLRTLSTLSGNERLIRRSEKEERLVEWNVQLLLSHLRAFVTHRQLSSSKSHSPDKLIFRAPKGKMVLDEVKEVIELPKFFNPETMASAISLDTEDIEISQEAILQLTSYVSIIASMYHDNAFHNFEHAR